MDLHLQCNSLITGMQMIAEIRTVFILLGLERMRWGPGEKVRGLQQSVNMLYIFKNKLK